MSISIQEQDHTQEDAGISKNKKMENLNVIIISLEKGSRKIRLTVLKENQKKAIPLYNHLGYQFEDLDKNNLIGFDTL